MKPVQRDLVHNIKCCSCEYEKYTFCNKNVIFHVKFVGTWSKKYVLKKLNYNIIKHKSSGR